MLKLLFPEGHIPKGYAAPAQPGPGTNFHEAATLLHTPYEHNNCALSCEFQDISFIFLFFYWNMGLLIIIV